MISAVQIDYVKYARITETLPLSIQAYAAEPISDVNSCVRDTVFGITPLQPLLIAYVFDVNYSMT